MRGVLCVVLIVAIVAALPPGTAKPKQKGSKSLNPLPNVIDIGTIEQNYTCIECYRMSYALQQLCIERGNLVPNKADFQTMCRKYSDQVTPPADKHNIAAKCEFYESAVMEMYCPVDPCSQISNSLSHASDAVCNLLRCDNQKYDMMVIPEPPKPPLSCPGYINRTVEACARAGDRDTTRNITAADLCNDTFAPTFEREGCLVVAERLAKMASPLPLCSMLQCNDVDEVDAPRLCEDKLNLTASEPVPASAYMTWRTLINGSELVLKEQGVNVSRATYGRDCMHEGKGGMVPTMNNMLKSVQERCANKVRCEVPNPRLDPDYELVTVNGCNDQFEVFYRCHDSGPLHRVYSPLKSTYDSFTLDCSNELPDYPELNQKVHPNTKPNPFNAAAEGQFVLDGAQPIPRATFDTPSMEFARNEPIRYAGGKSEGRK